MQNKVFEPARLAGISLGNRIIRSATHEGMADSRGFPTEKLKKTYARLAKGGVGAIITGYAGVSQEGRCPLLGMLMADRDECIDAYRDLVGSVHDEGVPVILQIAHCGRQTSSRHTGRPVVAPSAIRDRFYSEDKPLELTEAG
ncbi:NADH:flavin oxidoreductase, partial [bacterium]|nr:NADH:flavin oxidoreductase [bacterium]